MFITNKRKIKKYINNYLNKQEKDNFLLVHVNYKENNLFKFIINYA